MAYIVVIRHETVQEDTGPTASRARERIQRGPRRELMGGHLGSVHRAPDSWEGERLLAAGELGVPQVVAPRRARPGVPWRPRGGLRADPRRDRRRPAPGSPRHARAVPPQRERDDHPADARRERRGRPSRRGRPRPGDRAHRLRRPLRGLSAYDQPEETAARARSWAEGNGDGPTWEADPEVAACSRKAAITWRTVAVAVDAANEHLDVLAADMHILDPGFSELLTRIAGDMLDDAWRKGRYRDLPGTVG